MPDSTVHNHPPASPNPTPKQALRVALAALSWLVLAAKALGFWVTDRPARAADIAELAVSGVEVDLDVEVLDT